MDTSVHELKEYGFVEEFIVNKEIANALKVLAVILPALLMGVPIWLCLLGKNREAVAEAAIAVIVVVVLCKTYSMYVKEVDSTITLFDTYMIIKRNNIKYGVNDIRSESNTIHYDEVERIIFNRENNTLTINGMDEVIENKYNRGTKMYVAPPTKYKRDNESLKIKLSSDAYTSIVNFITDNTPLSIEIE